jgi:hypothetical protein
MSFVVVLVLLLLLMLLVLLVVADAEEEVEKEVEAEERTKPRLIGTIRSNLTTGTPSQSSMRRSTDSQSST